MTRIRLVLLCALLLLPTIISAQTPVMQLTFVGEQQIPTGYMFEDTEFGGISSIAYDAKEDVYYAISDDRSEHGYARTYTLTLDFDAESFDSVTIESVFEMRQDDGTSFAAQEPDAEGLAFVPATGTLIWSSERAPFLNEMALTGDFMRAFTLPDYYIPGDGGVGVSDNQAFEALTVSANGQQIITATESALMQDGPKATLEQGSLSRILVLDFVSGEVDAEYVYETGPIPHDATGGSAADNGLTELLALDDDTLLAVERSFAQGVGNTINIYSVELGEATNVIGAESLNDMTYIPVTKTPILTLEEGDFGLDLDNIEGVTFGPEIDGRATLVFVSDNNFNPRFQPFTQFLVFLVEVD